MASTVREAGAGNVVGRSDQLHYPNEIQLEEVVISNGIRQADVKRMLMQINIFEDLYSNTLTGTITLMDAVNLIGEFPFVGLEQVRVVFKTPEFPGRKKTDLFFDVYKISDRATGSSKFPSATAQVYTLHLVSRSYFLNQKERVRKSFKDVAISEMVRRITSDFLAEEVEVELTSGLQQYVLPSWTPFRAINWLAIRARPEANPQAANYLFYETINGFKFQSVNRIVQAKPTARFIHSIANIRTGGGRAPATQANRLIRPEIQIIRGYTILDSGSMMDRIGKGMYASKLITHDIVTKQFSETTYSYAKAFDTDKRAHIEDNLYDDNLDKAEPSSPQAFPGSAKHGNSFDSVVKFHPKHSFLFDGVQNYDESEKWALQRMSQLRQVTAQRIRIETSGLNFVSVGQIVILEVPRPENVADRAKTDIKDPEISGNYIVTNVHHIIELDDHRMILELSKESLPSRSNQGIADILDATSTSEIFGTSGGTDVVREVLTGTPSFFGIA